MTGWSHRWCGLRSSSGPIVADLLVTAADLGRGELVDIRVSDKRIESIAPGLEVRGDDWVLNAAGGGVLPGLHDHHVHLYSAAAARDSLALGPGEVAGEDRFAELLRRHDRRLPPGAWIRGIGYHERVAGSLDRHRLDRIVPHRPVRIQHRTGSQWVLNTAALEAVAPSIPGHRGIELDPSGSPTGRLVRMDRWIEAAAGRGDPCLAPLSERWARFGVTGCTDATPVGDLGQFETLASARADGTLLQRVTAMTAPGVGPSCPPGLTLGPIKLLLDDVGLPSLDELAELVRATHRAGRRVAVHCVTRVQLVLALAALEDAGTLRGDRVEHGSLIPAELIGALGRLGVTVVTNPGFVFDRGDEYLTDVEPSDRPDLYRCYSLITAGVGVAAGTDAPFGPDDPWAVARTAVSRLTRSGRSVGADERIDARRALSLFLGSAEDPTMPRTVSVGSPGDLCVLATPLDEALRSLDGSNVAATVVAGAIVADNR